MNGTKCMTCGLRNPADVGVCRRCGSAIATSSSLPIGSAVPATSAGYVGQPGFIGDHIRRTNRNLLVTNAIIAGILVVAFAVCGRYFYNLFLGPFTITEQGLTSTVNAGELSRYFVKVPIENVMEYTVQEVKTRKRNRQEEVVSEYFAVVLGEKLLLVKASPHHTEPEFVGSIENLPSESSEIIQRFVENDPGARDAFLPVMLDASGFRGRGYIGLAIGIPLLLLNLWNVRKALARRARPDQHPLLASLAKYGSPQTVVSQIDQEVAASGTQRSGPVLITASWLLSQSAFSLNIRSFDEIVWAYKKVTKHYTNFIPTGKTYSTIILDRHGKSLEITGRKEQICDSILEGIAGRAPWVLVGYGDDLAMAWKSDAAAVIKAVDQRHSQAADPDPSTQSA